MHLIAPGEIVYCNRTHDKLRDASFKGLRDEGDKVTVFRLS